VSNTDITNIETSDTFQVWLERTNDLIDLANENVMLAGPLGFTVEGSSTLTGTFTANTLVADSEFILPIGTTAERPSALIGSLRFNTDLDTFEGYDGVDWGEIGGELGNPIFINDNYNAEINDYIIADSTAASFSIILPASPEKDDIIRVVTKTASVNNVLILGNGNDISTIDGTVSNLTLTSDYVTYDLIFNGSVWVVFDTFGQTKITTDDTTNQERGILFTDSTSTDVNELFVSASDFSYNPSTKTLTVENILGNASTATALQTARTIGGVSFDGTANINLPGVNQTGNQNTTGSAATLTTARTINGVSFDGSQNITLPTVNITGNQTVEGVKTFSTAIAVTGTSKAAGRFYAGTTDPTNTTRVNYDGNFHVRNLFSVGDVSSNSDLRLKTDLSVIVNALDKVNAITGYTYTRIDTGERQTGVIAQDVQNVLPEAVKEDGTNLAVSYGNMVGLLVEAIKELQDRIIHLENKNY